MPISNGIESFSKLVTGLTANTDYSVRAYAITNLGTAYGNEVNFKTLELLFTTLTTATPASITGNSATLGGNITSDGNSTVTERGVCYSTSPNPTTSSTKVVIGSCGCSFCKAVID